MDAPRIKTLLIEDSGFMRIFLSDLLRKDRQIELVATANNGREGVDKVKAFKPDVVITDMVMPEYDGLYVVRTLMKEMPLPIILLSSLDRTNPQIFDALKEGAFDFLDKPHTKEESYPRLTEMVREASLTDYLKLRKRSKGTNLSIHTFEAKLNFDIIVIGASTGGPSAVELIVTNIPSNLSIPVIIAQHMPERFIVTFSERLAEATGLSISVANDGESLLGNHVYLAPGNINLAITKVGGGVPVFKYIDKSFKEFNHPSIDCVMESVAEIYGKRSIGVILTGMGKDGTRGLLQIKNQGGLTVTQNEESSVVYGMPKSAFESGAAMHQIPLAEIPNFIISAL